MLEPATKADMADLEAAIRLTGGRLVMRLGAFIVMVTVVTVALLRHLPN